jgi:hypothetical protein
MIDDAAKVRLTNFFNEIKKGLANSHQTQTARPAVAPYPSNHEPA